ncbi:MAG: T9SS type A sorting domain-containing protein [Bacteroidetes bacterium]|nr:T9SS type A sorting domain-containing protein [Bacteroidota bacterium]MCL2302881.1 T9SS type A sorting domain-containing protein [Lentimicrobiaceae bacterium]
MKKSLFFILAVAFCISLAAQPYTAEDFKNVTQKAYKAAKGATEDAFIPTERLSPYKFKGSSDQIGETHYVTASNCNARNTISWAPDGNVCAVVWTTGTAPANRGTGINYWDHSTQTWAFPVTTDRIEQGTTGTVGSPGWGLHVFTEEGECVVAHSVGAGGLVINTRAKYGEGAWNQQILKGPEQANGLTTLLWPTMAASGNTIHLVCVTDNESDLGGIPTCPLYYRSTDGGVTWENYVILANFMPNQDVQNIHTGDDFNIIVRGNHVVLAYATGRAGYLESKDGGNTWTSKIIYDNNWSWVSTGVNIGPLMRAATIDAAIGDDGVVHVAFSAKMCARDASTEAWYYSSYPALCAMFTWKEGQPTMQEGDMVTLTPAGDIDELLYEDLPNFMDAPGLLGFDRFYFWDPIDVLVQINRAYNNVGYVSHPRLIAQGGKVYLMYSSIIEQPMLFPSTSEFYRGVFLTVSYDNGDTYNQREHTSWLSYNEDYFFCDWSNYGGPNDAGTGYTGWIEFIISSENGFPTMSANIKNDRIICSWLNDYFPFPESLVWMTEPMGVFSMNLPTELAGRYKNTDCVWRGLVCDGKNVVEKEKVENLKIYPNPANNTTIIEVGTKNPYTLTVTNIMGQVVHTEKGQQSRVQLNVADYPAGVYIVNVKTAGAVASQKLIVK